MSNANGHKPTETISLLLTSLSANTGPGSLAHTES